METYFDKIKNYLLELDYNIVLENAEDEVFVIEREDDGIKNMVIGCAEPILILEQFLFEIKVDNADVFKKLLQKNRDIIHGAFVIDDSGKKILFRDTLQLENLDLNEIEASINSLSLLLSEFTDELILYSKS